MPGGLYGPDEYDLAGFAVGACERDQILDGSQIEAGDVLFGLPSSGLHSNGYSLVRQILLEEQKIDLNAYVPNWAVPGRKNCCGLPGFMCSSCCPP